MNRASLKGTVVIPALLIAGSLNAATVTDDLPRLDERTALMVGAQRLKLGVLAFDYGITEKISIGTDPPAWAARAFLPVLIPNLHLKLSIFERPPVVLAVQGAGYLAALQENGSAAGTLSIVPLSLFASFRLHPRLWLHGELTYNWVRAYGSGDLNDAGLGGQVAARAGQTGAIFEVRLTRIFSVTAMGRYQFYTGQLVFQGSGMVDPYTSVDVEGTAKPRAEHPWEAVAGVAFLWRHVHLILGAGYGYYFVPGIDIPYPSKGFVPDGSLSFWL